MAVQHHRSPTRNELATEELRVQFVFPEQFSPVFLRTPSFCRLPGRRRNCVLAEFIALGTGSGPPSGGRGLGRCGGWLAAMRQESFAQIWRKVLKEGRKVEVSGVALAKLLRLLQRG